MAWRSLPPCSKLSMMNKTFGFISVANVAFTFNEWVPNWRSVGRAETYSSQSARPNSRAGNIEEAPAAGSGFPFDPAARRGRGTHNRLFGPRTLDDRTKSQSPELLTKRTGREERKARDTA